MIEPPTIQDGHCLLQVADPSMHQLNAHGECARYKILPRRQRCLEFSATIF